MLRIKASLPGTTPSLVTEASFSFKSVTNMSYLSAINLTFIARDFSLILVLTYFSLYMV